MNENKFEMEGTVLKHCTVAEPHLVIPEGVTEIAPECFKMPYYESEDDVLVSVVIPESCVSIGEEAFMDCKHLEQVEVKGPAAIGPEAFHGCKRLRSITLADGVTSLGYSCFAYCEKLEKVFIPRSVQTVGNCIACQNGAGYKRPLFLCEAPGPGREWRPLWHLIYHDQRFGNDSRHMYFHEVTYGVTRYGFMHRSVEALKAGEAGHQPVPEDLYRQAYQLEEERKELRYKKKEKTRRRLLEIEIRTLLEQAALLDYEKALSALAGNPMEAPEEAAGSDSLLQREWSTPLLRNIARKIDALPSEQQSSDWAGWISERCHHLIEQTLGSASVNAVSVKTSIGNMNRPKKLRPYHDYSRCDFPQALYQQLWDDDQQGGVLDGVTAVGLTIEATDSNGQQHTLGSFTFDPLPL